MKDLYFIGFNITFLDAPECKIETMSLNSFVTTYSGNVYFLSFWLNGYLDLIIKFKSCPKSNLFRELESKPI